MKKKKIIVPSIIVLLIIVVGIYLLTPWIMQKKAEQIKEGMTYEEVTRIMGKEGRYPGTSTNTYVWDIDKECEFWVLFFRNESGKEIVSDYQFVEK